MTKSLYGKTADGKEVFSFTIKNESGAEIELLNYGATLNKISVPDRNGDFADVLVGFDTMEGQLSCTDSQGRTVGRVANRISGNGITIDGKNYPITKNIDGKFTLHGNHEYENAVWNYEILGDDSVKFSYFSADGNEGFPSNLQNEVTFTFTDKNEVKIHYDCRPDGKTPINVTNHSYFNLGGYASGNILSHEMQIFAKYFTPMNEDSIPTGEIRSVENTPFDFRIPKKIGRDVSSPDEQLEDFKSFIEKKGLPYFPIVAPIKYGTKELINAVAEKLSTLPPVKKYEAEEIPLSVLESKKNNGFKVTVNDGVYSVEADWLYRILSKTDLDDYASLQYFQTVLKSSGIIDELVKQGIQEGDTVSIYDLEFDYIP